MAPQKRSVSSREQAEALAIGALSFLASDADALTRFLRLTGLTPANLRSAAADPGFLAGVLDYFLANETLLMDYVREANIAPEEIARARAALDP